MAKKDRFVTFRRPFEPHQALLVATQCTMQRQPRYHNNPRAAACWLEGQVLHLNLSLSPCSFRFNDLDGADHRTAGNEQKEGGRGAAGLRTPIRSGPPTPCVSMKPVLYIACRSPREAAFSNQPVQIQSPHTTQRLITLYKMSSHSTVLALTHCIT